VRGSRTFEKVLGDLNRISKIVLDVNGNASNMSGRHSGLQTTNVLN
jgi:hypothetical protein